MENPEVYNERARSFFLEGYNCSQSVVAAFCEELGMDQKQAIRMASSFGGGMGRMREICGCVSGMLMVLGYVYGYDHPKEYDGKKELYAKVQYLAGMFKESQGSIVCRELLGGKTGSDTSYAPEKRTEQYYKKRPCAELAGFAAQLLAEYMSENPI